MAGLPLLVFERSGTNNHIRRCWCLSAAAPTIILVVSGYQGISDIPLGLLVKNTNNGADRWKTPTTAE
jgi:hypothetical protein